MNFLPNFKVNICFFYPRGFKQEGVIEKNIRKIFLYPHRKGQVYWEEH